MAGRLAAMPENKDIIIDTSLTESQNPGILAEQ